MESRKVAILTAAALFVGLMTGLLAPKFFGGGKDIQRVATAPALPPPASPAVPGPDYSLRINELKRRLASNPNDVDLLVQLGNTYFDSNMYAESIEAYERALALKPGNPDVLTDLGVMYRRSGRSDEAVKRFREAMAVSPTHTQSRLNLGVVLFYDFNDPEAAKEPLKDLLRVQPAGPQADNARMLLREIEARMGEEGGRVTR